MSLVGESVKPGHDSDELEGISQAVKASSGWDTADIEEPGRLDAAGGLNPIAHIGKIHEHTSNYWWCFVKKRWRRYSL